MNEIKITTRTGLNYWHYQLTVCGFDVPLHFVNVKGLRNFWNSYRIMLCSGWSPARQEAIEANNLLYKKKPQQ